MKLKIGAGTTSRKIKIFVQDSSSTVGAGLTGLAFNTAGLTWYYIKDGDNATTAVSIVTATLGTFTSSGFIVVDATNMPGVYEIGIPNAALASADCVNMYLKGATNMVPVLIEIELDSVNYQSATAFITGVNSLAPPTNWNLESIDASGRVDIGKILGTASQGVAGYTAPDWSHVNAPTTTVNLSGTTISTAQVIATVTNQLTAAQIATGIWTDVTGSDFTTLSSPGKILVAQLGGAFTTTSSSVYSTASLANAPTGGTAPTVAQIATAVWQDTTAGDFTTASSIGKALFVNAVPGAAGGHFIAGTNAATTVTTSFTTTFTGNLTGSVGSISGVTFPTNFSAMSIDTGGHVKLQGTIQKNTALNGFPFYMALSSDDKSPATGKTITATRSLDGGAFGACANAATEIANGWYAINLATTDVNGNTVALSFTATSCDATLIMLTTQP